MRVVLQRVSRASVEVSGRVTGEIALGLVVLLGISRGDQPADADYLVRKIFGLRIFDDSEGKMNLSVGEVGGALLIVSQFTLYGDCRKGKRPSFDRAAGPEEARSLYEYFIREAKNTGITVHTGIFQASMSLHLVNNGPVTIICDSARIA